jgi:glycogen operon protein
VGNAVNFALLCQHGTEVSLVIEPLDGSPVSEIVLDPHYNRTGHHWHVRLEGVPDRFKYGWRVNGPEGPRHRFDRTAILIDPAAIMLSDGEQWGVNLETSPRTTRRRALFIRGPRYEWGNDVPLRIDWEDSIIYELHVRGFTCHPSSGVNHPGTFLGLTEKIDYLKWLGVTAVELLPIHEFNENDCPFTNPLTGEPLRNFWGYNSIAFAAPKASYAHGARRFGQHREFRDMVKAFHAAGIEVILDVVFNHTGEGDDRGRTYSFRGLDNELYYMLTSDGRYLNFTGCGNTLNCNHPVVRDLLMTCLRYWVADMHIDGLRFDLASILGRDRFGHVLHEPPVIEAIVEDGVLADTKLIAEPWDAAGLYQVGRFPYGQRWSEWNGHFRDDVRRFWRGDLGMAGAMATRLCGSSDLYEGSGRFPRHSINFITCHDGFTLHDLVTYNRKYNICNGEGNRDGNDANYSWNCGFEGETDSPAIVQLRQRQARNLFASLMLAQGVPMILAGDEFLRTQRGNNNAWCQDNPMSWVDWTLAEKNQSFLRFCREMIWLRKRHPALRRKRFFGGPFRHADLGPEIVWHGTDPFRPDFRWTARTLAFALDGRQTGREPDCDFYVAMNAWQEPLVFRIPASPSGRPWKRVVDTAAEPPRDFIEESSAPPVAFDSSVRLAPFSTLILVSSP